MRGILAITHLPVSQLAQNNITNDETAGLFLIGILSPDSVVAEKRLLPTISPLGHVMWVSGNYNARHPGYNSPPCKSIRPK